MILPGERGPFAFARLARDPGCGARRGRLRTPHGTAELPAFMPVGTAATVKGVLPRDLRDSGSEIVLANAYHLALRPGPEVVFALGGLHAFMRWDGPVLTDSGGFQVWSLSSLVSADRSGATFRSHLDGSRLELTPERAIEIQLRLGSDLLMVLDECLPHTATPDEVRRSLEERTMPWAERSLRHHPRDGRAVFAIGQGGRDAGARRAHARWLAALPFDGFAMGGLSVGETGTEFREMIAASTAELPEDRPRYLMGVGSIPEMVDAIALGVDMFDCVLPTRNARNGQVLTALGPLRLRNSRHRLDAAPIEAGCPCTACSGGFSRAYLRHLFQAGEMLAGILATHHNLVFLQRTMAAARAAIEAGSYLSWRDAVLAGWRQRPSGPA
jgi:queuine tRNA-ribosyltransferase